MKQKVIIFSNQKGGVGKTTMSRLLGFYLADTGRKTLLVDTDPQANLSKSLADENEKGLYEALKGTDSQLSKIQPNLSILAGIFKKLS